MAHALKKPDWIKIRLQTSEEFQVLKCELKSRRLFTVCEEARCPNIFDCWTRRTATLMLLGGVCTRRCRFCSVMTGNPKAQIDPEEPKKCADVVQLMKLRYVVLTCVDRDDLPDGGAAHLGSTVRAIKDRRPEILIEALVGDFQGRSEHLRTFLSSPVDVYGHNIETVRSLSPKIRDRRASYDQSLLCLKNAKLCSPTVRTKSSLMLGLGETKDEVIEALHDLRAHQVDFVTIGQYLQPSKRNLEVVRYIPPEEFKEIREIAVRLGFLSVAAGPLVRSSYHAADFCAPQMSPSIQGASNG